MTNIKYLKENNLLEAHKHFLRLSEAYIPLPEELDEAGEDEQDPNAAGGMGADPMGGGAGMGGPDPMGGGDPNAAGGMGADPMGGGADPNAAGGDPMAGADGGMGGPDPMGGGDPNAAGGMDDPMAGGDDPMGDMDDPMGDPMEEDDMDDDTIDIDGLTKVQDKLNVKQNRIGRDLSKVDDRINKLIDTIGALLNKVDSNNSEIESLKAEFEKRNPTQTEKLNLRSLDSYPFNVKPNEYWEQKAKEGGYEAYSDNDQSTTKEYVITNDDVDNPARDIADTFFDIPDDDIQTLSKIFGMV